MASDGEVTEDWVNFAPNAKTKKDAEAMLVDQPVKSYVVWKVADGTYRLTYTTFARISSSETTTR